MFSVGAIMERPTVKNIDIEKLRDESVTLPYWDKEKMIEKLIRYTLWLELTLDDFKQLVRLYERDGVFKNDIHASK